MFTKEILLIILSYLLGSLVTYILVRSKRGGELLVYDYKDATDDDRYFLEFSQGLHELEKYKTFHLDVKHISHGR